MPLAKTAELEFEEFSYIDKDGKLTDSGSSWLEPIATYLQDHFGALSVQESFPYILVWCEDAVPTPSNRPFKIAGLVAVWLVDGKDGDPKDINIGNQGSWESHFISLDQELLDDLQPFLIPKTTTLWAILENRFPEALALSFISHYIIVELKETSFEEYKERIRVLPFGIFSTRVALRYHNGPIKGKEFKRLKEPFPTKVDGVFDDTDYVKSHGKFYPGTMLSSINEGTITSGIFVQKEEKVGFTVAIHCWDKQLDLDVELGHADYTVKQGDWKSGTEVGVITERIGSTDIGIADVKTPFSNRFLDLNGSALSLLPSNDVKIVNENFWIDTFVTGPQLLASTGRRVFKANRRGADLFGEIGDVLMPGTYIRLDQGVFSTSVPENNRNPKIREGVCGGAIIRAPKVISPRQATGPSGSSPTKELMGFNKLLSSKDTTGEVAGFMHWSNCQSRYNDDSLLCFADSVDEFSSVLSALRICFWDKGA